MRNNPLVSIVIVNFNGKKYLKTCVENVLKTKYEPFEVIVVDNGSSDGSAEFIRGAAKSRRSSRCIKFIINPRNVGPANARNQASNLARGSLLAFLDNDTKPDPNWLKKAVELFRDPEIGAVQCKIILDDRDVIDSIGSYLGSLGFLVQRVPLGQIRDMGQFSGVTDIFSTKSAGMLIKKEAFFEVGRFDPSYFIYNEEMDLCWRLWLHGYKVVFCPCSIVYHKSGTTKLIAPNIFNYLLYFHGTKNYIQTVFKNGSKKMLFSHVICWFGTLFFMIAKKKIKESLFIIKGIIWNLKNFRQLILKRQNNKLFGKCQIPNHLIKDMPISYYLNVLKRF